MAADPPTYRERPEVQAKYVRQELIKGWLALVGQAAFLGFGITEGLVAILNAPDFSAEFSAWRTALSKAVIAVGFAAIAAMLNRYSPWKRKK